MTLKSAQVLKIFKVQLLPKNLNSIAAHDFVKVPLIEAFNKASNIRIICLSETFLDSTIPYNNEKLYTEIINNKIRSSK